MLDTKKHPVGDPERKPTLDVWVHESQVCVSHFALYSHFQFIIVKRMW